MCGLVGVAGDVSYKVKSKVLKDMLDVCQLRGRDSTGVIKVKKDLSYDWMKQVGPPTYLYDSKMWDNRMEKGDAAAYIGHCRHKTSGEINKDNAHPFDFPDEGICGVHNGTLCSFTRLDTYNYQKVDSEVLYGHLAQNGPEETFDRLEGAWACVWWNDKEKTINFIRNDQRPLWFTWSKDARMMFWASEPWMFGAVSREIELWEGGENKKPYIQLPINTLWSFKINPEAKGDESVVTMRPAKLIAPAPEKKSWQSTTWKGNGQHGTGFVRRWEEKEDGSVVRVTTGPSTENTPTSKGGEVADPFKEQKPQLPVLLLDDSLDDLTGTSQDDSGISNLSNVTFLRNSIKGSGQSRQSTNTKKSQKSILDIS